MKKRLVLLTAAMASVFVLAGCGGEVSPSSQASTGGTTEAKLTGTMTMAGSTSMEEICSALNEAFMAHNTDLEVVLQGGGSGAAITALGQGTANIGNLSRAVKDSENADGKYEAITIALDGIAVIVHPDNPVADLSKEDLAAIFQKEKTDWKDFGGSAGRITVVGRETGSGTRDGFEDVVGIKEKCRYDTELDATGLVVSKVASDPAAIGYVSFASVKEGVKAVTVGGVAPSESTIADQSYVLQRPFVHAYKKGTTDPNVLAYLEFLKSDEAQGLIRSHNLVPYKFWEKDIR